MACAAGTNDVPITMTVRTNRWWMSMLGSLRGGSALAVAVARGSRRHSGVQQERLVVFMAAMACAAAASGAGLGERDRRRRGLVVRDLGHGDDGTRPAGYRRRPARRSLAHRGGGARVSVAPRGG